MEQFLNNINTYLTQSPVLAYVAAFIGGVGTSFTPCVYPIIPITVALVGAKAGGSRARAFFLSLVYVIGISTTYAFLGAFAALSGKLFGQLSASPWVNFILGNIFILLGLSMLDVFTFQFPAFLGRIRPKTEGKGFFTMYVMGLVSGLVAGPCTAAVLAALLAFVATRHNVAYGMSLLFIFSMGMGVLLIFIGTFAGALAALPKAGGWTEKIKKAMGWLMILIGEYFLI
ncbi:MAG: sulfite exporter TauE/SafE family protein, partial [Candidatus Omnitrophica bacterium]|nr:sulfite exporter TauE/SafE family protein [Candidatus Omnitrophota bacterium]